MFDHRRYTLYSSHCIKSIIRDFIRKSKGLSEFFSSQFAIEICAYFQKNTKKYENAQKFALSVLHFYGIHAILG